MLVIWWYLLSRTCTHMPLHQRQSSPLRCHDSICTLPQVLCRSLITVKEAYPYIQESLTCLESSLVSTLWQCQSQLFLDNLRQSLNLWFNIPSVSNTRFSGLMSLWMMFLLWIYSSPAIRQAMKNPVSLVNIGYLTSLLFSKLPMLADVIS